jgi:hypothetical protein
MNNKNYFKVVSRKRARGNKADRKKRKDLNTQGYVIG